MSWTVAAIAVIGANEALLYTRVFLPHQGSDGRGSSSSAAHRRDSIDGDGAAAAAAAAGRATPPASSNPATDAELDAALTRAVFDNREDEAFNLRFVLYGARDFVSAQTEKHRLDLQTGRQHRLTCKYLGRLLVMGGYATYGFVIGSDAHVIVAIKGTANDEMCGPLEAVAGAVTRAMCCPFRSRDDDLGRSASFVRAVEQAFEGRLPSLS